MKCAAALCLMFTFAAITPAARAADNPPIRVMSFNIRYGTANDGENRWENRKEFVVETIKAFDPDVLGMQEVLDFQRDYIAKALPGYGVWAQGREKGNKGEMVPVFYRKARFRDSTAGHMWLSESPLEPGSKSWDSSLPRMASYIGLIDKKSDSNRPIYVWNTHFDHRGVKAREESAALIYKWTHPGSEALGYIITGDFNSAEGSKPYRTIFEAWNTNKSRFSDTYRVKHPKRGDAEGTFSGFDPKHRGGARIDWIGVNDRFEVLEAGIDHTAKDGRTPSDHFPVTAVVRLKAE